MASASFIRSLLSILMVVYHVTGFVDFQSVPELQPDKLVDCNGSVSDVVFVLDSSGSVGPQNFTVMKTFVKEVINKLEIGPNKIKVGLITFSRYPTVRIHLNDYTDKPSLMKAVDEVPYIAGITETHSALELLLQEGFIGARTGAAHTAIVITDGQSFHPNLTAAAAATAKSQGVVFFAIGIGSDIIMSELQNIATDPDQTHVFTVTGFDALNNIVNTLTSRACDVKPNPSATLAPVVSNQVPPKITNVGQTAGECNETLADIVFVLDSSGSLGPYNFGLVKNFTIGIVNSLDIGPNLTQVGVITYASFPFMRLSLNQYTDKLSLINAINSIPYFPGNTETDKALDMLLREGFNGDRKNAPNVAIVITDGRSTYPEETRKSADALKISGITTFAIGIGETISKDELDYISTAPATTHVFFAANFTQLSTIEQSVAKTTCSVPSPGPGTVPPVNLNTPTTAKPGNQPMSVYTLPPTPSPNFTPTKSAIGSTAAPTCIAKVADVVFMLDASGSVGDANFVKMKSFVKQVINYLDIGPTLTRVGLIAFSSHAHMEFALGAHNTVTDLQKAVDQITYYHGGTNTAEALEMLRTSAFANDKPQNPNVAIVITDGMSKDELATKVQANLAKANNITLVAVGIGSMTDPADLNNIASTDVNGHLVYQVDTFDALNKLDSLVAHVACGYSIKQNNNSPQQRVTTAAPISATGSNCFNTIDNCDSYGKDSCFDYKPWATAHCSLFCGFCQGPPTTEPPCVDTINNCVQYGTYICTSTSLLHWTKNNCRKYCGFCGNGGLPSVPTASPDHRTTPTPECKNRIDNCNEYGGKGTCTVKSYEAWARSHCNEYCGFCSNYVNFAGAVIGSVTCPSWRLPKECTMVTTPGSCCPLPSCPDGYKLSALSPLQQ